MQSSHCMNGSASRTNSLNQLPTLQQSCKNVERLAPCCHHLLRCSCNREDPRATTAASDLNFAPCPMKYAPGILCSERVHLHGDVLFQSSRHGTAQEKNAVECTNTRLDLTICIFTLAPGQPGSILNIHKLVICCLFLHGCRLCVWPARAPERKVQKNRNCRIATLCS